MTNTTKPKQEQQTTTRTTNNNKSNKTQQQEQQRQTQQNTTTRTVIGHVAVPGDTRESHSGLTPASMGAPAPIRVGLDQQ